MLMVEALICLPGLFSFSVLFFQQDCALQESRALEDSTLGKTLGGVLGSLVCGFAGISYIGTHCSLLLLAASALAAAVRAA